VKFLTARAVAAAASRHRDGKHLQQRPLSLFELHLEAIVSALDEADFVELSQGALALGGRREDADS
jgi:hypothetical protein